MKNNTNISRSDMESYIISEIEIITDKRLKRLYRLLSKMVRKTVCERAKDKRKYLKQLGIL